MGREFILWVEGVDFESVLFDTSDLSTLRGGSLALLQSGSDIEAALIDASFSAERLSIGASRVVLKIQATSDEEIRKVVDRVLSDGVYEFINWVIGISAVEAGDAERALRLAEREARLSQVANLSIAGLTKVVGDRDCAIDRLRPAEETIYLPSDTGGKTEARVSASVAARRSYGREMRQKIYRRLLPESLTNLHAVLDELDFCDGFDEIVQDPPDVPLSARNKIAVFYADGNKFTAIRERISNGDAVNGLKRFSEALRRKQEEELLPRLLQLFTDKRNSERQSVAFSSGRNSGREALKIRFETLLWGGDEVRFVMPAWLGVDFAKSFFEAVKAWEIDENPLTFSASLIFANYKTPIRQLINFGDRLVDEEAKAIIGPPRNAISLAILESLEVPYGRVQNWRYSSLGIREAGAPVSAFALAPDAFADMVNSVKELKVGQFARSQFYNWLRESQNAAIFEKDVNLQNLEDRIELYFKRAGSEQDPEHKKELLQRLHANRAYAVWYATQLWDYVSVGDEHITNAEVVSADATS